jgi:hypothetical protein
MLQESFNLSRVERQWVNIGLFDLLFNQVLSVLLMLPPELIRHPLEFLEITSVLLELL